MVNQEWIIKSASDGFVTKGDAKAPVGNLNLDEKKENGNCNITNFRHYSFEMRFEVPEFKVVIYASDLEFLIELNEHCK